MPERLEQFDEGVAGRTSVAAKGEVVLCSLKPCAAEVALRVSQAAFEKVVIDVHTGIYDQASSIGSGLPNFEIQCLVGTSW